MSRRLLGGCITGMFRSMPMRRLPGLTLALLALFGLLLRGQVTPNTTSGTPVALFASFQVAFCHTGHDDPRHADHPAADCDACLLCQAARSDHAGTPVIPRGAEPPVVSVATFAMPVPPVSTTPRATGSSGLWARAPPADA
ncbi:MAG: hypothetical protein P4L90_06030 [Rhodopila sp.]|nr:hypothetical protein [Rhodopila sp.]